MTTADGTVLGTTQISGSAPRNRAFNIVLLAEGFRSTEQAAFNSAADAFVAALFATPPYDHLRAAINVFRVNVASTDSGADDPTSTGGTGAVVSTYFDATFGAGGIRRLLVCNDTTALTVASAQVPEHSLVLVVVNSTVYGGSGGSVGTYSLAGGATEIAIHEAGHTAYGLADEYPYYAGGAETGHDHYSGGEPAQPNVTANSNRSTLKWRWAVASSTAVPTMSNPDCSTVDSRPSPVPTGTVGLFEGAFYFHCGAFRPEYDCKMRELGVPFCAVCRQAIWNRIGPLADLPARPATPISVVARYPEHLDVFAAAADGRTMSNWWDASSSWAGWFQLSGGVASSGGTGSPITSISRYSGHLDIFTIGTDNRVYSAWWDVSAGWSGWFRLGSLVARPGSTVNVVARYNDHLDLFTTASNGATMSIWWDAHGGWASDWFQVSGGVAANGAPVTALSRYRNHLDLFTVGTDNRVYSTWWDDRSGWAGWFPLGSLVCRPNSTVTAVSRTPDHIDLFTTASNGAIMSTWWDARGGWANWFQVSGGVASPGSPVTALARFSNHLDLFTIGTDNRIYSTWWDSSSGWAGWFNVSGGIGEPGGQVAAIQRITDHIDLFVVGSDSLVYSTWWDSNGGWANWFPLGVS
ncbi:M64 family metallopeptidase [Microbacterium rhizosphaerae]|uniref:M64 family metallopeptidase n=1 Tax=Microbacterium rhizosphaerae TaxID=1678237 RepID=A0ABZ0SMB5_9MICO|nr:M64 family metallopeptidase [Microbacterium rhizosphaerae]WPR89625.1 M64 family metallopeptidase [Microbacterium rhizosphaerae]